MDPVAEFAAEHVVYELVLGDPAESGERRPCQDSLEMGSVAGDGGARSGNRRFDAVSQLIR